MEGAVEPLEAISKAERLIKDSWKDHDPKPVEGMRSTLVLEPMVADLSAFVMTSELGAQVKKMMWENVFFRTYPSRCMWSENA